MDLQSFEYYLQSESLKESSITEHIRNIERLQIWADENSLLDIQHLTYAEILAFVQHLKQKNVGTPSINTRLNSLRKYYEHLKQEGIIETNPARRINIKGSVKTIVVNPLTYTELEKLYHDYITYINEIPIREARQHLVNLKRKAMLGILIWQGVHSGELKKMCVEDIKLSEGIIYVPGSKSQSRELKLEPLQIIPLHEYVNSLPNTQKVLFPEAQNDLFRFVQEIKGINPQVKNAHHIRSSVVLNWLKIYDKRKVQYLIGHKWIGSTERYEIQELTGLTDLLQKHHPFS